MICVEKLANALKSVCFKSAITYARIATNDIGTAMWVNKASLQKKISKILEHKLFLSLCIFEYGLNNLQKKKQTIFLLNGHLIVCVVKCSPILDNKNKADNKWRLITRTNCSFCRYTYISASSNSRVQCNFTIGLITMLIGPDGK